MRTTIGLFSFAVLISTTSFADDSFEIVMPDQSTPSSSGFVESFSKESSQREAPSRPAAVQEEDSRSDYDKAFSSYRSKRSSEDDAAVEADAWRAGQEKPDNFDVESLTYTQKAPSKKPAAKAAPPQARVKESQHGASNRAPSAAPSISDDQIEMPLPDDSSGTRNELNRELASVPDKNDMSPSPASSAKERKAMILQTISENYPELKTCYNEGLSKKSEMKGKVVIGWSMDPQGRVSGAEIQTSQLNNKEVEKCMIDRLSSWHFPRQAKLSSPKDRMTYTFQFVPERD